MTDTMMLSSVMLPCRFDYSFMQPLLRKPPVHAVPDLFRLGRLILQAIRAAL